MQIAAAYDYRDADGALLYQAVRLVPKEFRQRRPDGRGGWIWSLQGTKQVPYRLPELLEGGPWIFVVEGEKDADTLHDLGFTATCNAMGAGKWRPEFALYMKERRVVTLPDNDPPGKTHALSVARSVYPVAESVKVIDLPGLPEKGDVSDWLTSGGTPEELVRLVSRAPRWQPEPETERPRRAAIQWRPRQSTRFSDAVQAVKQRADLLRIFSAHGVPIRYEGTRVQVRCPFHQDDTPSLSIWTDQQTWRCFGCGEHGDAIDALRRFDGLTFRQAVEDLAREHGIDIPPHVVKPRAIRIARAG